MCQLLSPGSWMPGLSEISITHSSLPWTDLPAVYSRVMFGYLLLYSCMNVVSSVCLWCFMVFGSMNVIFSRWELSLNLLMWSIISLMSDDSEELAGGLFSLLITSVTDGSFVVGTVVFVWLSITSGSPLSPSSMLMSLNRVLKIR